MYFSDPSWREREVEPARREATSLPGADSTTPEIWRRLPACHPKRLEFAARLCKPVAQWCPSFLFFFLPEGCSFKVNQPKKGALIFLLATGHLRF